MESIIKAWLSVVRLKAFQNKTRSNKNPLVARATGFMYQNEDGRLHLITNRHVVWNPDHNYHPDLLIADVRVFQGPPSRSTMSNTRQISFELNRCGRRTWKALRSKADIAALEIDQADAKDWNVTYLSSSDLLPEDSHFLLGTQALVLGFPKGDFYDEVSNLPIARSATIATDHRLTFNKTRCFLVDAELHEGMSGSPVVSMPRSIYKKGNKLVCEDVNCYLLGVFSAEWLYEDEPLGLHTVWWPELIEETTQL